MKLCFDYLIEAFLAIYRKVFIYTLHNKTLTLTQRITLYKGFNKICQKFIFRTWSTYMALLKDNTWLCIGYASVLFWNATWKEKNTKIIFQRLNSVNEIAKTKVLRQFDKSNSYKMAAAAAVACWTRITSPRIASHFICTGALCFSIEICARAELDAASTWLKVNVGEIEARAPPTATEATNTDIANGSCTVADVCQLFALAAWQRCVCAIFQTALETHVKMAACLKMALVKSATAATATDNNIKSASQ